MNNVNRASPVNQVNPVFANQEFQSLALVMRFFLTANTKDKSSHAWDRSIRSVILMIEKSMSAAQVSLLKKWTAALQVVSAQALASEAIKNTLVLS
ncbi:hypothetical protein D3C87_1739920 [compost metagenome]